MNTSPAIGLAAAGIIAAIMIFVLGTLALILALVAFGFAIIAVASEIEELRNPAPKEPPHPVRYACPGCGGDVYTGQATCPACGHTLTAPPTP